MRTTSDAIIALAAVIGWLAGIVLAKGIASTTLAILIPLWAWYLVVEYAIARLL